MPITINPKDITMLSKTSKIRSCIKKIAYSLKEDYLVMNEYFQKYDTSGDAHGIVEAMMNDPRFQKRLITTDQIEAMINTALSMGEGNVYAYILNNRNFKTLFNKASQIYPQAFSSGVIAPTFSTNLEVLSTPNFKNLSKEQAVKTLQEVLNRTYLNDLFIGALNRRDRIEKTIQGWKDRQKYASMRYNVLAKYLDSFDRS